MEWAISWQIQITIVLYDRDSCHDQMHCGWQQVCESGALYTVMPPPSSPALPVPVSPALPGPGFSCSLSRAGAQSQSGPPCETVTLSPVTRCQH